jgi:bacterioferritin
MDKSSVGGGTSMIDKAMIDSLNRMLSQEHACAIRYATHAAVVTGPYAEAVAARLKEIAGDEVLHAEKLRARILALGGTPTMEVRQEDLKPASGLDEILRINIGEEHDAIAGYTKILETIPPSNVILLQTIQEIIRDEQEHLEELEALQIG